MTQAQVKGYINFLYDFGHNYGLSKVNVSDYWSLLERLERVENYKRNKGKKES